MPALSEKYDKAAALLEAELDASEQEAEQQKEKIGEQAWTLIKSQMDSYRSYTDKEGERRGGTHKGADCREQRDCGGCCRDGRRNAGVY